jgi:hypothetical protein
MLVLGMRLSDGVSKSMNTVQDAKALRHISRHALASHEARYSETWAFSPLFLVWC